MLFRNPDVGASWKIRFNQSKTHFNQSTFAAFRRESSLDSQNGEKATTQPIVQLQQSVTQQPNYPRRKLWISYRDLPIVSFVYERSEAELRAIGARQFVHTTFRTHDISYKNQNQTFRKKNEARHFVQK